MSELRCENKLHGIIVEENIVEITCGSSFCGAKAGVTVLHRFDTRTGELVSTNSYRTPERSQRAAQHHPPAVRSA